MDGDGGKARVAYQDFFALWKDADLEQASWWAEHWPEGKGWHRVHPSGRHKTRQVLSSGDGGNALFSGSSQGMP